MIQRPTFSVIVPTYNRLDFLKQALSSIWAQTFRDYEVVVVDDGSNDGTQQYLQELGNKVWAIRQANSGPGAARNIGVREARGDYVAFLDSDDLWFPWTLEIFARAIREHGNPHILGGKFVEFTDERELLNIQREAYGTSWFADYIASSRHPYFIGSGTCALRRESFAQTRFLEDRLNAEDHDLTLQMGTLPGFVRILAPVTLAWRRHPGSETGDFARSVAGILRLLEREKSGVYPGGSERSRERHRILARHTRPIALACVRKGMLREGWNLYRSTFGWNVQFGRYKYLLGFLSLAICALLSQAVSRQPRRA
jgi:glycosyltransferase involved in cell wall biosynthesis